MAKIAETESAPTKSIEERYLELQERMLALQEKQADAALAAVGVQKEQARQTKKRSNDIATMRSPYNPRGDKDYPMPPLKCAVHYQFGMTSELHSLDREEVELMNLVEPGQYTIEMADNQPQVLFVVARMNDLTGKMDEMQFRGPKDEKGNYTGLFTEDRKGRFPSTKSILRQILGDKANDVMTMKEEVRRINLPSSDPLYLPVSLGE